jgi:hypothetical protein
MKTNSILYTILSLFIVLITALLLFISTEKIMNSDYIVDNNNIIDENIEKTIVDKLIKITEKNKIKVMFIIDENKNDIGYLSIYNDIIIVLDNKNSKNIYFSKKINEYEKNRITNLFNNLKEEDIVKKIYNIIDIIECNKNENKQNVSFV